MRCSPHRKGFGAAAAVGFINEGRSNFSNTAICCAAAVVSKPDWNGCQFFSNWQEGKRGVRSQNALHVHFLKKITDLNNLFGNERQFFIGTSVPPSALALTEKVSGLPLLSGLLTMVGVNFFQKATNAK